jgi:hypothetical protein
MRDSDYVLGRLKMGRFGVTFKALDRDLNG